MFKRMWIAFGNWRRKRELRFEAEYEELVQHRAELIAWWQSGSDEPPPKHHARAAIRAMEE